MNHFAVCLKPTQDCKSTMLQYKKTKNDTGNIPEVSVFDSTISIPSYNSH